MRNIIAVLLSLYLAISMQITNVSESSPAYAFEYDVMTTSGKVMHVHSYDAYPSLGYAQIVSTDSEHRYEEKLMDSSGNIFSIWDVGTCRSPHFRNQPICKGNMQ